jgi:hypothetical protein
MSITSYLRVLLPLLMLSGAASCARSNVGPSQMVQLCLRDEKDTKQLVDLLKRVASENEMEFIDRSSASQIELTRLQKDPGYKIISISASRSDGLGFAAGNLGLGAHEIAIGFTNGNNTEDSSELVHSTMRELGLRWSVRSVPEGHGAMKSPVCDSGS